jgi:hypothetical protein
VAGISAPLGILEAPQPQGGCRSRLASQPAPEAVIVPRARCSPCPLKPLPIPWGRLSLIYRGGWPAGGRGAAAHPDYEIVIPVRLRGVFGDSGRTKSPAGPWPFCHPVFRHRRTVTRIKANVGRARAANPASGIGRGSNRQQSDSFTWTPAQRDSTSPPTTPAL